ncbi:hypothetical protein E4T42_00165 [Aureobasidium subglaciale]|nr:hypothetical protein E4T42_00165 [Aureobasidium subglaciale]
MPTNWKSLETLERFIAALIASNGGKNRTRAYKKSALALIKEVEGAGRLDKDMKSQGAPKKVPATPKKPSTATPGSAKRVTKRTPKVSKSKARVSDDSDDDMADVGTAASAANDEEV